MSNFTFSVSVGRATEFYARVDGNDPANSALILVVLAASGLESDTVLKAKATLADVLSGTTNEVTNTNYARKTLTDSSLSAYTVDTDLGQIVLPLPTQTFSAIQAGDLWRKLLVCYDSDTTAGTDANIVPITAHDLLIDGVAVTPTGDDIVISAPTGFAIAS
jgi:hypothetical protein